jgi:hypothetical protein
MRVMTGTGESEIGQYDLLEMARGEKVSPYPEAALDRVWLTSGVMARMNERTLLHMAEQQSREWLMSDDNRGDFNGSPVLGLAMIRQIFPDFDHRFQTGVFDSFGDPHIIF